LECKKEEKMGKRGEDFRHAERKGNAVRQIPMDAKIRRVKEKRFLPAEEGKSQECQEE